MERDHDSISREDLIRTIAALEDEKEELLVLLEKAQGRFRKERDFLFSLIDGIPAYIYLQAKDYSIHYANKVFQKYYGNYQGKKCFSAMHNLDSPCKDCRTFVVFETLQPQDWISYNWQGPIYHVYDYPFLDESGEMLVLEMGIDVTEHQKYEDLRTELFANISHELRSPLARIMGYTESLRDGIYKSEEDCARAVECMYLNCFSLNKLIGDLFELSKLDTPQAFQLREVNLYQALLDFCGEQELFFAGKPQLFSYSIEKDLPVVKADVNRIVQVLENIIDNAVRYTSDGDGITVTAANVAGSLQISVADTGSGISRDDIKHVFSRFYQGTRSADAKSHSGLGLNICKTIVEQHGGRIWVQSQDGQGSVFYIAIPEWAREDRPQNL
jgi:signal transduction histidine kinase